VKNRPHTSEATDEVNPSFILIENVHERQDGTSVLGENVSSGQDDFASTFRAVREFIEKKR